MSSPDVSVVIPVYNTRAYLGACLDSLLTQTIGTDRIQVVAVDDGSTDGSGELLDRYAQAHPDVILVHHQENSGGPAGPCNVGLDHARGRYVFFLGSDDRLGEEALARMVDAADEWGADVVCGRIVGTDGRWVNQRLFKETVEDIPFPSRVLASGLSNTKLFRRDVIEQHSIRFPEDMRVGSDQPFTIEAMLHARKISVLADYDYYYAIKREDAGNLTYSTPWRTRLADMTAIVEHIADLLPPGDGRDQVLARHFSGELARLLRVDYGDLPRGEQEELARGVGKLVDSYLTGPIISELNLFARLRHHYAAHGRPDELRSLAGAEDRPPALAVLDGRVSLELPGQQSDATERGLAQFTSNDLKRLVPKCVGEMDVALEGSDLVVSGVADLPPDLTADARFVLSKPRAGRSRGPALSPRETATTKEWIGGPLVLEGGRVTGRVPLSSIKSPKPVIFALRLELQLDDVTFRFGLTSSATVSGTIRRDHMRRSAVVRPDVNDRILVEVGELKPTRWIERLLGR